MAGTVRFWKWCMVSIVSMAHDSEHGRSWWNKVRMVGAVENGGQVGPGIIV